MQRQPAPATALPAIQTPVTRPAVPKPQVRQMDIRSTLPVGTIVTSSGTLGSGDSGPLLVQARWGSGPWYRLATTTVIDGAYRVRWSLTQRGSVHIRILLPNGDSIVGSTRVT